MANGEDDSWFWQGQDGFPEPTIHQARNPLPPRPPRAPIAQERHGYRGGRVAVGVAAVVLAGLAGYAIETKIVQHQDTAAGPAVPGATDSLENPALPSPDAEPTSSPVASHAPQPLPSSELPSPTSTAVPSPSHSITLSSSAETTPPPLISSAPVGSSLSPSATPETSPAPEPTTSAPVGPSLTTAQKRSMVAQTMIVGFDASSTSFAEIKQVVADTHIGGIFLTGTTNGNGLYYRLSRLPGGLLLASDEEGGQIERLSYDFNYPSAKVMGGMTPAQVRRITKHAGQEMHAAGVTLDLSPVLDLDNGRHDGAISRWDRSFGGTPQHIATMATAEIQGLQQAGVSATLKHFPGIGRATPDSDTDSHAASSPPFSTMKNRDMLPYKLLIQNGTAKIIMLSNEYVTGLDGSNPASISPKVVDYLRHALKFKGIITTDSLTALQGYDGQGFVANVVAAEKAGVDLPLFSFTTEKQLNAAIAQTAATVPAAQIEASYQKMRALKHRS